MIQKPLRIIAWLVLLMLAFFTLSPIELRPHAALPAYDERLAGYLVAGLLFAAAYPKRIWLATAIVLVSVFAPGMDADPAAGSSWESRRCSRESGRRMYWSGPCLDHSQSAARYATPKNSVS